MHSRLLLAISVWIWCFFAAIADTTDVPSRTCSHKRSLEVAADVDDETCLLQKGTRVAGRSKRAEAEEIEDDNLDDDDGWEQKANSAHPQRKVKKTVKAFKTSKGQPSNFSDLMGLNTNFYFDIEDNLTLTEHFYNEIKFEVAGTHAASPPVKNKLILLLLEITIVPGFFGIDRCYMEQPFMGLLKALTFSGLGFWGLVDTIVVMFNSVSKMNSMHTIGFVAEFDKDSTILGFYLGSAWLSTWAVCCCCSIWCGTSMKHKHMGHMPAEPLDLR